ncbi:MAG: hypothetical protein LBL90_04095 [Prevotellaceae bacterium]|jgi:hypothetical protein|nr:hypothetical protein [Prevotellaceae bacterium]
MKRYIILFAVTLLFSGSVFSQTYLDALRFSQQDFEGTARFTSMGGAFGALGGDFTSLSLNPAGIGVYRSSELTITPTLSHNKVKSEYMNVNTDDSHTRFSLSNIGYVGTFMTGKENGLVSINFGVGYNKAMSYYRNTAMRGGNSESSIMDHLASKANSDLEYFNPDDFEADNAFYHFSPGDWDVVMAYGTNIIEWNKFNDGMYDPHLEVSDNGVYDKVRQLRYTTQSGTNGEYVFSFGGNISNKFYFGATFGLQDLFYENTVEYAETAVSGNISNFDNFSYREYFHTSGTGYNIKLGVIYRPISEIRIGAAIHTPTYFYLTDEYWARMNSRIGSQNYEKRPSDPNLFDYRINTPLRLIGSFAYTFGKVGLLSVDYEYINYSGVRMNNRNGDRRVFDGENDIIKEYLRGTSNVRVGGEAWLSNNFVLRAGFMYNESADKEYDMKKFTYSVGLGYKYNNFFADFAYAITSTKDYYSPYSTAPLMVTEKDLRNRFMLTFGFRF